jgi:hypothetical protein
MSRVERIFNFAPPFFQVHPVPGPNEILRDAIPDIPQSHQYDFQIEQDLGHGFAFKGGPFWRRTDNLIETFKAPNQPASLPQAAGPYDVNGIETDLQFLNAGGGGLTGYLNYTHTRALADVTADFEPALPPGAQLANALFPASFVPPNAANLVLDWKRGKWEINPVIDYSSGFPYGTGAFTYNNQNCANGTGGGDPNKPCGAIVRNPSAYQDTSPAPPSGDTFPAGMCGHDSFPSVNKTYCTMLIDPNESKFADGRVCCVSLVANLNLYYNISSLTTVGVQIENINRDYRPTALEQNFTWPSGNNGYLNYGTDPYMASAMNGSEEFLFTVVQKI